MIPRDERDYSYGPQGGIVLWGTVMLVIAGIIGGLVGGFIALTRWLFF